MDSSCAPIAKLATTAIVIAVCGCQAPSQAAVTARTRRRQRHLGPRPTEASRPEHEPDPHRTTQPRGRGDRVDDRGEATSADAAAGAPPASACSLVSQKDASAAIGSDAGPGKATPSPTPDASQCLYQNGALIISTNHQGQRLCETSHRAIAAPGRNMEQRPRNRCLCIRSARWALVTVTFYNNSSYVSIILPRSTVADPAAAVITRAKTAAIHT